MSNGVLHFVKMCNASNIIPCKDFDFSDLEVIWLTQCDLIQTMSHSTDSIMKIL